VTEQEERPHLWRGIAVGLAVTFVAAIAIWGMVTAFQVATP
jgi:hypothetical protein